MRDYTDGKEYPVFSWSYVRGQYANPGHHVLSTYKQRSTVLALQKLHFAVHSSSHNRLSGDYAALQDDYIHSNDDMENPFLQLFSKTPQRIGAHESTHYVYQNDDSILY